METCHGTTRRRSSPLPPRPAWHSGDRKSTRLNSSHVSISYAVFCLKKKSNHHPVVVPPFDPGMLNAAGHSPTPPCSAESGHHERDVDDPQVEISLPFAPTSRPRAAG